MNKNPTESELFLNDFFTQMELKKNDYPNLCFKKQIVFFIGALCASSVARIIKHVVSNRKYDEEFPHWNWGGQNCYWKNAGAFTGENSPQVLAQMGATHCLVGHSERRQLFHESNEEIAQKVKALQDVSLIPVLCVGETLQERASSKTFSVLIEQLEKGLSLVNKNLSFWVAYEPVWAIGTGNVATVDQVKEVHEFLSKWFKEKFPDMTVPLLYGGSVKPDSAMALAKLSHVDGFLIGGASLEIQSLLKLMEVQTKWS
ncbi:MAG: triose-phosphate isomerase [Bdellovibrionales bacterium]|nr:triose-phosphate isomerase [Bdellovibrionales bacterium]